MNFLIKPAKEYNFKKLMEFDRAETEFIEEGKGPEPYLGDFVITNEKGELIDDGFFAISKDIIVYGETAKQAAVKMFRRVLRGGN